VIASCARVGKSVLPRVGRVLPGITRHTPLRHKVSFSRLSADGRQRGAIFRCVRRGIANSQQGRWVSVPRAIWPRQGRSATVGSRKERCVGFPTDEQRTSVVVILWWQSQVSRAVETRRDGPRTTVLPPSGAEVARGILMSIAPPSRKSTYVTMSASGSTSVFPCRVSVTFTDAGTGQGRMYSL